MIHDGSSRNRRAEPRGPDAYSCSTEMVRGRARRPEARCSSGSAIAAEAFMNNAG